MCKLFNNYQADIIKSQQIPLLIELTKNEISSFVEQPTIEENNKLAFIAVQRVYDRALRDNATNIIALNGDANKHDEHFFLLNTLLDQLSLELKEIKNITSLKETIKAGASVATGGLLNSFIGSYLDKGVDYIFDEAGEYFSKLIVNSISDNINVSNTVISNIEDLIHDTTSETLGDFIANKNNNQINLSSIEKSALDQLSKSFAKSSKHDVFQLTFKILLAISLETPKVIYINNPHKLDDNSLAIISLLLSYAKHQKDIDKHVGISIIYTYNDTCFQPYSEVDEAFKLKQQLLDCQRGFARRYAMFERPGSDTPKVAVKSSVFIGRNEELKKLQDNFNDCHGLTLSVVSGEPGIGKTTLVNKHLVQIEEKKRITLTLLNEVGHCSSNVGLTSLENSIIEEATRLELLKNWKEKGISGISSIVTKDNAVKAIGTIFTGVDKMLSVAIAGHERLMVDSHISSVKDGGIGDLDNQSMNQKEKLYNKLDLAIEKLLPLVNKESPLVLFIDDCQWIDNNSAEYILNRLSKKLQLYIIITIRPSDAVTRLKQLSVNPELNEYSIAFLKTIINNGHQTANMKVSIPGLVCHTIHLTGFNTKSLNELVSQTIQGESSQLSALCDGIFSEIAGNEETTINTLFAVESINMLCDEKLYSENGTEKLILNNPLRINHYVADVDRTLKNTFTVLRTKYKNSFSHYEPSSGIKHFNLMAYAVLEERLHLLKIYFSEYGNAAINTLLFSSLIGVEFSSSIVKGVLEALAKTDVSQLSPLKKHIRKSQDKVNLNVEHYAIIDEVYEILSRYPLEKMKYKYRNILQHAFLDKQLEYLLNTLFTVDVNEAKECMLRLVLRVIQQQHLLESFYGEPKETLNADDQTSMLFFRQAEYNIVNKGFEINSSAWAQELIESTNKLASDYLSNNQLSLAISFNNQALEVTKSLYNDNPTEWLEGYAKSLINLATSYKLNNQLGKATELYHEALKVTEETFLSDLSSEHPAISSQIYVVTLNKIIENDDQVGSLNLGQAEDNYKLLVFLYKNNSSLWRDQYLISLENMVKCYIRSNKYSEAVMHLEESAHIINNLYEGNPKQWLKSYVKSLVDLANTYFYSGEIEKAVTQAKNAKALLSKLYKKNKNIWAELSSFNLNTLAMLRLESKQNSKAITLQKEALFILNELYKNNSGEWLNCYADNLNLLAVMYKQDGQLATAISLEEESFSLIKSKFESVPSLWVLSYLNKLNSLAVSYQSNNELQRAIGLQEEFNKVQSNYPSMSLLAGKVIANKSMPFNTKLSIPAPFGFKKYTINVPRSFSYPKYLTAYYLTINNNIEIQFDEKIKLLRESIAHGISLHHLPNDIIDSRVIVIQQELLGKILHMKNKETSVSEPLTCNLNNVFDEYLDFDVFSESDFQNRLQNIIINICKKNPIQWAKSFVVDINRWALTYTLMRFGKRLSSSSFIEEVSLNVTKSLYQENPEEWADFYLSSINECQNIAPHMEERYHIEILEEELVNLIVPLYKTNPSLWANQYINALENLALSCFSMFINKLPKANSLVEELLDITKSFYQKDSKIWGEKYVSILRVFATQHRDAVQMERAFELEIELFNILKSLLENDQVYCQKLYIISLNNLALYSRISDLRQTCLELQEESISLVKKVYMKDPTMNGLLYVSSLENLATSYKYNEQLLNSIAISFESLNIIKDLYLHDPISWIDQYIISINCLIERCRKNKQHDKVMELEIEYLELTESIYKQETISGGMLYSDQLNHLVTSQDKEIEFSQLMGFSKESFEIARVNCRITPKQWIQQYLTSLECFTKACRRINQSHQAIEFQQESVNITKKLYENSPEAFADCYTTALRGLFGSFKSDKQLNRAFELQNELLNVYRMLYKNDFMGGSYRYQRTDDYLFSLFYVQRQVTMGNQKLAIDKEIVALSKHMYELEPDLWRSKYSMCLSSLARSYQQNNQLTLAIQIAKEALYIEQAEFYNKTELITKNTAYIDIFSNNLIDDVKNINEYFTPFIAYYHSVLHQNDEVTLKILKEFSTVAHTYLKAKFGGDYDKQLRVIYEEYTVLVQSETFMDRETLFIFEELFYKSMLHKSVIIH